MTYPYPQTRVRVCSVRHIEAVVSGSERIVTCGELHWVAVLGTGFTI
jgi:hypothetical protein